MEQAGSFWKDRVMQRDSCGCGGCPAPTALGMRGCWRAGLWSRHISKTNPEVRKTHVGLRTGICLSVQQRTREAGQVLEEHTGAGPTSEAALSAWRVWLRTPGLAGRPHNMAPQGPGPD